MKAVVVFFSLCFLIACNKEETWKSNPDNLHIIHGPCGELVFKGKIGNDFAIALDSLLKSNEWFLPQNYCVEKDTITVDFNDDNRLFISIAYKDANCELHIASISDVLDTQGNYYRVRWCED
jgi:hypothetical protein